MSHNYPFVQPTDFYASQGLRLRGTSAKELRWRIRDSRVAVGRGTYGAPTIVLYSKHDFVSIGRYCSIANDVVLLAGGEHNVASASTFPFRYYFETDPGALVTDPREIEYAGATYKGPITIGNDVWIGYGATILSGVTIGNGAVVGARAVVAKNVAPYSIVVGNPARVVRVRFPETIVNSLLGIRWWDWKEEIILEKHHLILGNPNELVNYFNDLDRDQQLLLYSGVATCSDIPSLESLPRQKTELKSRSFLRELMPPILLRLIQNLRH